MIDLKPDELKEGYLLTRKSFEQISAHFRKKENMQKVIMEFDPNEDKEEIECALHAGQLLNSINEFKEWLHQSGKYSDNESLPISRIQQKLNEIIRQNNCEFIFNL